ncbi:MAG: molybdopterin-guanine dinucleotide biosynthesis protein MobA [Frankiales bacterium]|nr:molybdopterin-guanine dinucleotide biosynthesis protein MobA [Frankiales bacterium]
MVVGDVHIGSARASAPAWHDQCVYDALVLAGGGARRMGGADKPSRTVGGVSLLDRVLTACAGAATTVVVGPQRDTCRPVLWTREDLAGSGPVAAVAAGLELVTAPHLVLLAGDLPFLTPAVIGQLVAAVDQDGAMLVDDGGRDQYLCSAWRTSALRQSDLTSDRLALLLKALHTRRLALPVRQGRPPPWMDCDTEADLQQARELA